MFKLIEVLFFKFIGVGLSVRAYTLVEDNAKTEQNIVKNFFIINSPFKNLFLQKQCYKNVSKMFLSMRIYYNIFKKI